MPPTRTLLATERDLLWQWLKAKQALEDAKNLESDLRSKLVASSKSGQMEEGRETLFIDAEGNYKLTIDHKLNYKFDYSKLPPSINEMVADMQDAINNALNIDCIIVNVEFSSTKYNKADENTKALLSPFITIKPGTPQVNYVPPTKKDEL